MIKGVVQGVGFRPHVFRVARDLALTGFVKNTSSGVCIEIQRQACIDTMDLYDRFIASIKISLPPLASITDIKMVPITPLLHELSFEIIASEQGETNTLISPDVCICSLCLSELFDPCSHYYRYPFLNCTNCGPRLTITHQLPYDRAHTSMACFPLCHDCSLDYSDPMNRRYHAQPTACMHCGPQLSSSIGEIAQWLSEGKIVALKGLGGYQLICNAQHETTVMKLRTQKQREAKPFALMVLNTVSAAEWVEMSSHAEAFLNRQERPIIVLKKKNRRLLPGISPDLSSFGMMLPSTPLHYLLFHALLAYPEGTRWIDEKQSIVLVVTSANIAGEPLIIDDVRAIEALSDIADRIVSYDRAIVTRVDDTVISMIDDTPMLIRRARGYVPQPIRLPKKMPSILAVGAHSKNTICITRGDEAFVSQHIGTLDNQETIRFFHETLDYWLSFLKVNPVGIAHDLHPDFYTTQIAHAYGLPTFAIQHHHAHLAAVMAEHHCQGPVLGLILDGYGYGENGEAWGGELFLCTSTLGFQRLASLMPLAQPGGEIAVREPWRMGAAILHQLGLSHDIPYRFKKVAQAPMIRQLLDKQIRCPVTSSCGRLFDAASALLGIDPFSQYEGQAAMKLESLVTTLQSIPNGWEMKGDYLDFTRTMSVLVNIEDSVLGANLFHGTLIEGLSAWVKQWAKETGVSTVVLNGGCFLNQVLTSELIKSLQNHGIKPILPIQLPPNDGGLSLGQAWIAGSHFRAVSPTLMMRG